FGNTNQSKGAELSHGGNNTVDDNLQSGGVKGVIEPFGSNGENGGGEVFCGHGVDGVGGAQGQRQIAAAGVGFYHNNFAATLNHPAYNCGQAHSATTGNQQGTAFSRGEGFDNAASAGLNTTAQGAEQFQGRIVAH